MPELPEVEAARRLVEANCLGRTISEAIVADDDKIFEGVSPADLERDLKGKVVAAVSRRGKHMWLDFKPKPSQHPSLLIHFGMTGGIAIKDKGGAQYRRYQVDAHGDWPPRFCKMELLFTDGTRLAFCDSRRFGRVRWIKDPLHSAPLNELGWDPLLSMPSAQDFATSLSEQRRAIKALLLDQSFSAGIGNWVADEVCFQARVHPEQPAHSLLPRQAKAIHQAIQDVCKTAANVNADIDKLPEDWLFHQRWNKGKGKSYVNGHEIKHITVGGRSSAYVPALQKLGPKTKRSESGDGDDAEPATEEDKAGGHEKASTKRAKQEKSKSDAEKDGHEKPRVAGGKTRSRSTRRGETTPIASTKPSTGGKREVQRPQATQKTALKAQSRSKIAPTVATQRKTSTRAVMQGRVPGGGPIASRTRSSAG